MGARLFTRESLCELRSREGGDLKRNIGVLVRLNFLMLKFGYSSLC